MIELLEGFWVDPWEVKVVKAISENRCAMWITGQNAENGYVLEYPASDVVQAVLDAREEDEDDEDDEDEEED